MHASLDKYVFMWLRSLRKVAFIERERDQERERI